MDTKTLTVDGLVSDEGSILVLSGIDEQGTCFWFAADHRAGHSIMEAFAEGEEVEVEVESWQIL